MQKSTLKEFQQSKTPMEKISRSFSEMAVNEQRKSSQMSFSYFPPPPQFRSNPPEYSAQPIPSYMFPYQNYMGASMNNANSIFE